MRSIVIVLGFVLTLAALAPGHGQDPKPTPEDKIPPTNKIKSVRIEAIGESFAGVRYNKSVTVSKLKDTYRFAYTCSTQTSEIPCPCKNFEADIEEREAKEIIDKFRLTGSLLANSICCDHPYTLVSITDDDDKVHLISNGTDILRRYEQTADHATKILGIDCRRGLRMLPSPAPR